MSEEKTIEVKPPYVFRAIAYCEVGKDQLRRLAEEFIKKNYIVELDEETPQKNSYNHTTGEQGARFIKLKIYSNANSILSGPALFNTPSFLVGQEEDAGVQ